LHISFPPIDSFIPLARQYPRFSFGIFARLGMSEPPRPKVGGFRPIRVKTGLFGPDIEEMMKDPAVKIALALCVLLTGVSAAMLFRRNTPAQNPAVPAAAEPLLIRHRAKNLSPANGSPSEAESAASAEPSQTMPPEERPAALVTPSDRDEPPPPLVKNYADPPQPARSRWGVSMDMMLPPSASTETSIRTHKIVDGDTLASLAERFLGSADRAGEIFERNRDVLLDPNLLPIGVELKIPPRVNRPAAAAAVSPADPKKLPMTPIPDFGKPRQAGGSPR
jgi:hypothetical protein